MSKTWVIVLVVLQLLLNFVLVYKLGVQSEKVGQLEDMVFNGGYENGKK